jgi:hypothetical protein
VSNPEYHPSPTYHPKGDAVAIEVGIVTAPDGRPAVCLQFPDGYILMPHPEQVIALAEMLVESASDLRERSIR